MITSITKANADKYRALFAEAIEALTTHDENGKKPGEDGYLGKPVIEVDKEYKIVEGLKEEDFVPGVHYVLIDTENPTLEASWSLTSLGASFLEDAIYGVCITSAEEITTLDEYFSYIGDLGNINEKFTILPLDEHFFEINANTREIIVPQHFKTNGISVTGDEIAEVLYFKIDRFFDMEDLAETAGKEVFIQWKAPADADGKRLEGVSQPWVFSENILPGYIIIGWPLTSKITANPGTLEFSVRFYVEEEDTKEILYSFSTLTASAEIKKGLNYDLEMILADESLQDKGHEIIRKRLVNSSSTDEAAPDPEKPEIIEAYFKLVNNEKETPHTCYELVELEDGSKYYKIYLTDPVDGVEYDCDYSLQAITSDTGRISYAWLKKDIAEELVDIEEGASGAVFIPVDDETTNFNKVYYIKEVEGAYTPYTFTAEIPDLAAAKENGIELYERLSHVIINKDDNYGIEDTTPQVVLGSYQSRIANRLGRKIARTYSDIALVEGPAQPVIVKDLAETGTFDEKNEIVLQITTEVDSHAYTTYDFERLTETGDFDVVETLANESETILVGGNYGDDDDGDGFYRVTINSKLNSTLSSIAGELMRITHKASPVDIVNSKPDLPNDAYNINNEISIVATPNEFEKRTAEDKIEYQWFRYVALSSDDLGEDINASIEGVYVVKPEDIIIEGATNPKLKIVNTSENETGYYFCQVTNHYNKTSATKCSSFFDVRDTAIN